MWDYGALISSAFMIFNLSIILFVIAGIIATIIGIMRKR